MRFPLGLFHRRSIVLLAGMSGLIFAEAEAGGTRSVVGQCGGSDIEITSETYGATQILYCSVSNSVTFGGDNLVERGAEITLVGNTVSILPPTTVSEGAIFAADTHGVRPISVNYLSGDIDFDLSRSMSHAPDGRQRETIPLLSNAWTSRAIAAFQNPGYSANVGDLAIPIPPGGDPNAGISLTCKAALVAHGDKGPSGDTCDDFFEIGCIDIYDCEVTISIGRPSGKPSS